MIFSQELFYTINQQDSQGIIFITSFCIIKNSLHVFLINISEQEGKKFS